MPLLRRGVKNIVACVATKTEPSVTLQQFATGKPPAYALLADSPLHGCGHAGKDSSVAACQVALTVADQNNQLIRTA
jgi:hypothetical protein